MYNWINMQESDRHDNVMCVVPDAVCILLDKHAWWLFNFSARRQTRTARNWIIPDRMTYSCRLHAIHWVSDYRLWPSGKILLLHIMRRPYKCTQLPFKYEYVSYMWYLCSSYEQTVLPKRLGQKRRNDKKVNSRRKKEENTRTHKNQRINNSHLFI